MAKGENAENSKPERETSFSKSKSHLDIEFIATNDFDGPKKGKDRGCTDIFFLLLLICGWIAMTCIGWAALGVIHSREIHKGDPERLLRGVDYKGHICGVDSPVQSLEKKWIYSSTSLSGICVKTCPDTGDVRTDPYTGDEYTADFDTVDLIGYCVNVIDTRESQLALDTFGDFIRAAGVIGITGFVVSVILCYLYLFFLRIPCMLTIIVWTNIIIIEIGFILGAALLLSKAGHEDDSDDPSRMSSTEIKMLRGLGSILVAFSILWLCLICYLRERIQLAISLLQEAAACITAMVGLPFYCLVQAIGFVGFSAIWLLYTTYLVSSAEITTNKDPVTGASYKEYQYSDRAKQSAIFMVFMWLWTTAFIQAIGQLATAHSCLVWYFAEARSHVSGFQIFSSSNLAIRYHMGTAAFGSLILAVINMVRIALTYIKKKFTDPENRLHRCVLCCFHCCLTCLEECVKFINKHAYIQCAMEGTSFFPSAMRAFGLIARNIARVAMVTVVGSVAVAIGKICVMVVCSALAYLYMSNYMKDQLTGYVLPTLFVAFIAWLTATMFLEILTVTSDTLLQGFLIEEEFERNAAKGRGLSKAKSHAQKSMKGVLDKQQSMRPDVIRQHSQL